MDFKTLYFLLGGTALGLVLYGLTFFFSIQLEVENLLAVPDGLSIVGPMSLFTFGNMFSSFSEDILTRGYVFKHLPSRSVLWVSPFIYVLNHIHRLGDGIETYTFLLALGIFFMLPLYISKSLWFTGAIHWAGNCFFYYSRVLCSVEDQQEAMISANYLLAIMCVLLLPLNYWIIKKLTKLKSS